MASQDSTTTNESPELKKTTVPELLFEQKSLHDAIYLRNPFTNVRTPHKQRYLIFLISGNPGLIEYYRSFLGILYGNLTRLPVASEVVFEVYGRSMGGFELGASVDTTETRSSGSGSKLPRWLRGRRSRYYDLQQQIAFVEERLCECVEQLSRGAEGRAPRVVLVGHSVGSYVLLELVRRHRERLERKRGRKGVKWMDEATPEEVSSAEEASRREKQSSGRARKSIRVEPDIVGGICLFPTVVHIAASPSGRILSSLSAVPLFPSLISGLSKVLTRTLPAPLLRRSVQLATGLRGHNLATTLAFLRSPRGVHQALLMGADEMRCIGQDAWDAEVWGAVHPSPTRVARPRLFFYFGESDHWVANHTRDDLMRIRGRGEDGDEWRPWMEIDQLEIPHGFCLDHSGPVADKVVEYVRTIVELDHSAGLMSTSEFSLARNRLSSATLGSNRTSMASF